MCLPSLCPAMAHPFQACQLQTPAGTVSLLVACTELQESLSGGWKICSSIHFCMLPPKPGEGSQPYRAGEGRWTLVEGSVLKHPTSESSGMTVYLR